MERDVSLTALKIVSAPRRMDWDLTPVQDGVICGHFSRSGTKIDSGGRYITGLHPGIFQKELPISETVEGDNTFGRAFFRRNDQFPTKDIRTPGWSHWSPTQWWPRITEYILQEN